MITVFSFPEIQKSRNPVFQSPSGGRFTPENWNTGMLKSAPPSPEFCRCPVTGSAQATAGKGSGGYG
jgi:hypothetical protein